jgi:hypothetical protein
MSFSSLTCSAHKFDYGCSNVHDRGDSSENLRKNTESPDPTISAVHTETDLAAKVER